MSAEYPMPLSMDAARMLRERQLYFAAKRFVDIVVASILLLLLLPLMLLIGILIRLDSPGPAIFKQKRVGLRRRPGEGHDDIDTFTMYKFRTMRNGADSGLHRAFVQAFIKSDEAAMAEIQGQATEVRKLVHDPRVTGIGRFLRKTSLDELPQLWNVINGDMTLVGPRPPIPYEVDMYEPWHYRRLEAIPGLTGLWQVEGRSSVEFDNMVRLDIKYIENQSLWLDFRILVQTPLEVLRGNGAT